MADWALIVQRAGRDQPTLLGALDVRTALVSLALILGGLVVIIYRGVRVARQREESEMTRLQLEHAAKLATVGELAGGIAHEINNPLAIISEEAGLVKDLMNPEFGGKITYQEITAHLNVVQEAVFRARDITRNLLDFVRKSEFVLEQQDIHEVIHEVVDGFITREMAVEDITIKREFGADIPEITTNKNQLKQVLLNIIKNARDAIQPPGTITISTTRDERNVYIAVTDTGIGMTREQLGKIFLPFYTTKDVGKGTGLGLSVSYGMVKSLGGTILVDSVPKRGSTFTVVLPVK
jgi:two-component system NtrC family sensor kinase